jgi:hypothetical protein
MRGEIAQWLKPAMKKNLAIAALKVCDLLFRPVGARARTALYPRLAPWLHSNAAARLKPGISLHFNSQNRVLVQTMERCATQNLAEIYLGNNSKLRFLI